VKFSIGRDSPYGTGRRAGLERADRRRPQLSLALRLIGGDLAGSAILWQSGGIAGEVAILLFLASTATGVARALRARRRPGEAAPPTSSGRRLASPEHAATTRSA
jgi:hypothetical protein